MNYVKALLFAGLLSLVAFRPWSDINRVVGLRDNRDSLLLAIKKADSVLVNEGMAAPLSAITGPVVLVPTDSVKVLAEEVKAMELAAKNLREKKKKLSSEMAMLRRSNAQKQDAIVSLREINEMVSRQNKPNPQGEESDLEKDLNKKRKPDK